MDAEQQQDHIEWVNYRTSHSDHCIYGDLDPRFLPLERPIDPNIDHITPYAINPTTKAIRRSGLYRKLNNFNYNDNDPNNGNNNNNNNNTNDPNKVSFPINPQQQQVPLTTTTTTKRRRNIPKQQFSSEDIIQLDTHWKDIQRIVHQEKQDWDLQLQLLTHHLYLIIRMYSTLQKAWIPELVEQLRRIDGFDETSLRAMVVIQPQPPPPDGMVSENSSLSHITTTNTTIRYTQHDHILMQRVYQYYIDPSRYRQSSLVTVIPSKQQKERDVTFWDDDDDNIKWWDDAYSMVQDLKWQHLMNESVMMTKSDTIFGGPSESIQHHPTKPHPSSSSIHYLTLPYTPIWVDTIEQLYKVRDILQSVSLVAMDAEWHDTDSNSSNSDCMLSTLQIAIVTNKEMKNDNYHHDTMVFVIDLLVPTRNPDPHYYDMTVVEYRDLCQSLIREMFRTKIVLGFAVSNDMKRLEHYCGGGRSSNSSSSSSSRTESFEAQPPQASSSSSSSSLLSDVKCLLDVQSLWKHCSSQPPQQQVPGLARCVQDVMTTTTTDTDTEITTTKVTLLSKEYQCSNWSQRPLLPSQLHYAGLDAVIVLYLLSEMYRRRRHGR
jgi:hypothetical protein